MISALIIFYVFIAITLIALVLLQDPKGGGGAIFGGGGGGQSLFGATGGASFVVKATRTIAILFALCVIGVNYTLMQKNNSSAVDSDTQITEPLLGGAAKESAPEKVDSEAKADENSKGDQ